MPGKVGWLFTGQGSQWPGMGLGLEQSDPVFAEGFAAACAAVDAHLPVPIRTALADPRLVGQTLYTQAGLFVVAAGLVSVLRDWGCARRRGRGSFGRRDRGRLGRRAYSTWRMRPGW